MAWGLRVPRAPSVVLTPRPRPSQSRCTGSGAGLVMSPRHCSSQLRTGCHESSVEVGSWTGVKSPWAQVGRGDPFPSFQARLAEPSPFPLGERA